MEGAEMNNVSLYRVSFDQADLKSVKMQCLEILLACPFDLPEFQHKAGSVSFKQARMEKCSFHSDHGLM